jgi:secretion/DNA translocation related TadE-like protein
MVDRTWAEAPGSDRGSGSVLGLAVIAAVLCLAGMLVPLVSITIAKQRVTTGADAAALAAADVAAGILPGVPCEAAASVTRSNGLSTGDCELRGEVVTVSAHLSVMGFEVTGTARAGPPGAGAE